MAGHTAACDENDIYIFGGVRNSQFEIVTKFISISIAGAKSNIDKKNNMLLSEADENAWFTVFVVRYNVLRYIRL